MAEWCEQCDAPTEQYFVDEFGDIVNVCGVECQRQYLSASMLIWFKGFDLNVDARLEEVINDYTVRVRQITTRGARVLVVRWVPRYLSSEEDVTAREKEVEVRMEKLRELVNSAVKLEILVLEEEGFAIAEVFVPLGGSLDAKERKVNSPDYVLDIETLLEMAALVRSKTEKIEKAVSLAAKASSGKWIPKIRHPGALRKYAKQHGLLRSDTEKLSHTDLKKMLDTAYETHNKTLRREVQFALAMEKIREKHGKK